MISTISFADDAEISPTSSAALSLGIDSDQNKNRQLQLNIELAQYQQLSAGYGDSLLNTSQYYIGIATSPYEAFSVGAEYSQWGKNNGLEIRSLQSDIYINSDQWSFSLSPQINVVTFYGNDTSIKYDLYSQGITLSTSYYGFEQYFISANYYINRFADDPFFMRTQTSKDLVISRISESAQLLMAGLEKHHEGISAARLFNWGSIEIDWTQSSAALVEEKTQTFSLIIDYQLSKRLTLSVITSQQSSANNTVLNSIDLGIAINF